MTSSAEVELPRGTGVVLRPASPADGAQLFEWRNEVDVVHFSLTGRPVSVDEHAKWLAARLARPAPRLWIAEEDGKPLGHVRVDLEDETGMVSIAVALGHRGRGVGSRMLRALQVEVERDAAIRALRALVHTDNVASLRAFDRVGFKETGRRVDGFVVLERSIEAKR
jgi:RimJ/RimL family protein N-acetyltransferase